MPKKKDAPTSWRTKMRMAHNIEKSHPDGAKKLRKQAAAQRKRERTNAKKALGAKKSKFRSEAINLARRKHDAWVASVSRKRTRKSNAEPVTRVEAATLGLPFVERPKNRADVERRKSLQREGSAAAGEWTVERNADGQMMATHTEKAATQLERNLLRIYGEAWSHITPESKAAAEIQMQAIMEIAEAAGRAKEGKRAHSNNRLMNVAGFLSVYLSAQRRSYGEPWILSAVEAEAIAETLMEEGYSPRGYRDPRVKAQPETDNAKS